MFNAKKKIYINNIKFKQKCLKTETSRNHFVGY